MIRDQESIMSPQNKKISKHAKYISKNPISRFLINKFFQDVHRILSGISFKSVVDIGCGEGLVLKSQEARLNNIMCYAIDEDILEIADAANNIPFCHVAVGSAYNIPLQPASVDLAICTEVLEHLELPEKALKEIHRVTAKYAILSVPREPIWRMLNMIRGSYWNEWGNTPGHLNHWNTHSFQGFVEKEFKILKILTPLPWTMVLCQKRSVS